MAEGDWPKVLYHTAIRHRYNAFGRVIEGYEQAGDVANPNYPHPEKGNAKLHYKTQTVGVYVGGIIDEGKSRAEVERLQKEGWVTDPNLLKEEYED